ncbi:alpha/beta-hydrolase [Aspergillus eucalypticola CBS 122712]|uniref:Alpha/beta-hydrolase n=1 Tax=Aspergillus eucalypticola (strain CBS 122712 / IBT 29274) TaxID=1448314 RepID=A0A317W5Z1_ASPEC|nr:alpha/beta-hydrolase [Aspergillus eucalypticola CBS 122712]PWY81051.1 alpha/beta-hydrolase [Aspergillus eucalypticola CBS 122712]
MTPLPTQTHGPPTGHPILIIPGWEMTPESEMHDFEPIFTNIPNSNLRRVYIALPGTASTPARNITSLDDMYHHLVHFIDTTLGDARFMLIGSSCGAYLARAIAQKYMTQIDGLLLRVPLVEPEDRVRDVDRVEPLIKNDKLMDGLDDEDRTLLGIDNGGKVLVQTEGYVGELVRKYREVYVPAEKGADKGVLDLIRGDVGRYRLSEEVLGDGVGDGDGKKLMAPTLVVCGRQDESVGYRDCLGLLEKYPRATFAVLDRGTHGLPVDASERGVFGALVRDWVFRAGEWRDSHH